MISIVHLDAIRHVHETVSATYSTAYLQVSLQELGIVTGAAVIANLFESYLGAVLQGKALWVSNDIVNAIQITLAAVVALLATAYLSACQ